MSSLQKIRITFQRNGYSPSSQINYSEFEELLTTLMGGQSYDEQVANQLWQQASNGSKSIKVDEICKTINQGQNILKQKVQSLNDQIIQKQKNKNPNSNKQQLIKLQNQINILYQDKKQYQQDLRLVSQPFGINLINKNYLTDLINHSNHNDNTIQSDGLKWLLYGTLIYGIIQIIIIYGKYDFLNLIVVSCLLSIYLLNNFDQMYVKLTLGLIFISQILDFIWLIIYAKQYWNPSQVSNNSSYQIGYLRFIVFFTVVLILLKIPLGYFLFLYRNASPDNEYTLMVGAIKMTINANKSNPISRGLSKNLSTQQQ